MTIGNRHPDETLVNFHSNPEDPWGGAVRWRGPNPASLLFLARCLLVWPAVFASVVIATFMAVAVYFNDPGGPLFWLFAWITSAITYALVMGLPLALCAHRRRWYLRLVPVVIAALPVVWVTSLAGAWTLPATATIAVSIMVETTGWRQGSARAWKRLSLRR